MPAGAVVPDALRAAQSILDARAAAVTGGDKTAFLATVDPQAPAPFRDAQARSFDGLRSMPVASYSLKARMDDTGDLSAGLAARYGGASVFLPETRQSYRLRDFDDRDAVDSLWLTFVQRGDAWYVGGDTDLEDVGLQSSRNIWDIGPVQVMRTEHFLVISHPAQAARAKALAGIAEDAAANLDRQWDRPWSRRIPMVLPGSVGELEALLQSTIDLDNFIAFVAFGELREETWAPTAPRIFIQDRGLSKYGRPFQVQTLSHELSHAASVPLDGPVVPAWVHEGLADWIARGRSTSEARPHGSGAHLPRDYQFDSGPLTGITRAYAEARGAIAELAREKGTEAPVAFFAALGAAKSGAGSVDFQTDLALRRAVGIGIADLEANWARR